MQKRQLAGAEITTIQPKKLNSLDRDFLTGVNIERMKEIVAGENK